MKRNTTIVLFASIFAVAVGTLGLGGNSAFLVASAVPQAQEGVSMLGHVEYKHLDEFGNIKGYMQQDNIVVVAGKDCAAAHLFTDGTSKFVPTAGSNDCIPNPGFFTYIGVGNGTLVPVADDPWIGVNNATLQNTTGGGSGTTSQCADDGANDGAAAGGEMARRNVTATFVSSGTSTVVTLDTSGAGSDGPFTFVSANATDVTDSGLFNADYELGPGVGHTCGASFVLSGDDDVAGVDWNMFSRQVLNNDAGITVTDGDSLSVKWTITVG